MILAGWKLEIEASYQLVVGNRGTRWFFQPSHFLPLESKFKTGDSRLATGNRKRGLKMLSKKCWDPFVLGRSFAHDGSMGWEWYVYRSMNGGNFYGKLVGVYIPFVPWILWDWCLFRIS